MNTDKRITNIYTSAKISYSQYVSFENLLSDKNQKLEKPKIISKPVSQKVSSSQTPKPTALVDPLTNEVLLQLLQQMQTQNEFMKQQLTNKVDRSKLENNSEDNKIEKLLTNHLYQNLIII